ncbi:DNA-binding transcriptional LysR family regulator [Bradyrhizobium japonicum]|jgi:DNA-binding transcriptional LysR family regulator
MKFPRAPDHHRKQDVMKAHSSALEEAEKDDHNEHSSLAHTDAQPIDLNSLQTFVAVVRAGGFAAAARETNTPRSSVSLRIRSLEAALGARLFKRSTRAFALTAAGRELYQRSAGALALLVNALRGVSGANDPYAGEIRITLPADFPVRIVAAAIGDFRNDHPNVRFEVSLTNDVLDLISQDIDIALRIGAANPQEALIKGAIDMKFGLYASADYVSSHGIPVDIREASTLIGPSRPELLRLLSRSLPGGATWPAFHVAVDSFALARELVLNHRGIGLLPEALCRVEYASGLVVPVLPEQFSGTIRLHLTYPSRADLSAKVADFSRVFERHLASAGR